MTRALSTSILVACALALACPALASPAAERAPAEAALVALTGDSPDLRATWRDGEARPWLIAGLRTATAGATPEARAASFLASQRALLGVDPGALRYLETRTLPGRSIVRMAQTWQGLPVVGRVVVVNLDAEGRVTRLVNGAQHITAVPAPAIEVTDARVAALTAVGLDAESFTMAQLGKLPAQEAVLAHPGAAKRVFLVRVVRAPLSQHLEVQVDATTGDVLSVTNRVLH